MDEICQNKNKIKRIIISGSGLPQFIIEHEDSTVGVYSCMKVTKLGPKDGKCIFSVKIRCLNQKVTGNRCLAGMTLKTNHEEHFVYAKIGRQKSEQWGFKLNNRDIRPTDFDTETGKIFKNIKLLKLELH